MEEEETLVAPASLKILTVLFYLICGAICYVPLIYFGITFLIDWQYGFGIPLLIVGIGFLVFIIYSVFNLFKRPRYYKDALINQALNSYRKNKKNDLLLAEIIQQLTDQERNYELLCVVEDALKITPKEFDLLYIKSTLLILKGEVLESIKVLKKALQYKENDYFALCNLGSSLHLIMRYEEAKVYLQKALLVQPDNFQANEAMGGVYVDQMKWTKATQHLEKAYADNPNSDSITFSLCITYVAIGQKDKAMDYLEKTIKLNPGKEEYQKIKEELVAKDFDFDWFINELKTTGPRNKEDFIQLKIDTSLELYLQGLFDEALKGYNIILAIDPTNFKGLRGKISTLQKLQRYDEALKLAKDATKLYPDVADFLTYQANVLSWYRQIGKAKRLLTKAIENDPTYPAAHGQLAIVLEGTGKYSEALSAINKAIELDPENEHNKQIKNRLANTNL